MIKIKFIPESTIKIPLPDVVQEKAYSCGAAALTSIINYYAKGPIDETEVSNILGIKESGTDPYQIVRLLKILRLKFKEYRRMTIKQLKKCIDDKKPVLIMIQAWGRNKENYENCRKDCKDGHWIVAIGYDKENIYFEDPSLNSTIGFISIVSLDSRWHDIESYSRNDKDIHFTDHYGIAVWGNKIKDNLLRTREIL